MTRTRNQPRGATHYRAKLNDAVVREIKVILLYISDSYKTQMWLAETLDVSYNCIYDIWKNRSWKHIELGESK